MLNFRQWGDIALKPPVVFLHGLLGELQSWNTQAKHLAEHYPVLSVDLRNHGASPHLSGMSYAQMSDDLLALLDHLGLAKINLIGHSMGGKVAMYFALHHPQRVEKLIIIDIAPAQYPVWHMANFHALLALPLATITSRQQADELLSSKIENAFERGFLLKNLAKNSEGYYWKCNLKEILRQYLKIAAFPLLQKHYDAPAWFIKGADSNYITETNESAIKHYFPQYQLHSIADSGHLPHVQQSKVFYQLITQLLAST